MEENSIDRIRTATFAIARRGYDTREVETFLTKLADWLESGGEDEARSELIRRELERVGQRTAGILASAEDSAVELRGEGEQEAKATIDSARVEAARAREDADKYSKQTRGGADAYSTKVRTEADEQVAGAVAAAEAKARRIVDDGIKRRRDIEAVISDLVDRRDSLLAQSNKLADELRGVTARHAPADGADVFALPEELDPEERVKA